METLIPEALAPLTSHAVRQCCEGSSLFHTYKLEVTKGSWQHRAWPVSEAPFLMYKPVLQMNRM